MEEKQLCEAPLAQQTRSYVACLSGVALRVLKLQGRDKALLTALDALTDRDNTPGME